MSSLRSLALALFASLRSLLPLLLTIGLFEVFVLGRVREDLGSIGVGVLAVLVGLAFLVRGLEMSLFPVGESLTDAMTRGAHPAWLLGFAFALGFGSTAAEPALAAVASQAADAMVSDPNFPADEQTRASLALQMRYGVSVGIGLALVLGVLRILKDWSLLWIVLPAYWLLALVSFVSDAPFVAVALDAGAAATSAINIPLMMALGIGLAAVLRARNPLIDGFGVVVVASITPMLIFLAAAFVMVGP